MINDGSSKIACSICVDGMFGEGKEEPASAPRPRGEECRQSTSDAISATELQHSALSRRSSPVTRPIRARGENEGGARQRHQRAPCYGGVGINLVIVPLQYILLESQLHKARTEAYSTTDNRR